MADVYRTWSASLPLEEGPDGPRLVRDVRPWNGKPLTDEEAVSVLIEAKLHGPQAALEWLSEHVR